MQARSNAGHYHNHSFDKAKVLGRAKSVVAAVDDRRRMGVGLKNTAVIDRRYRDAGLSRSLKVS
jgi:hypothetical protein